MSDSTSIRCVTAVALACLAASGCALWPHQARPDKAPAAAASAPVAASPAPAASAAMPWSPPPLRHLDAAAMVGQTWTFPSADAQAYGDNRFVFKRDRVEASNAHEHVSGTWSVDSDKLCVVLNASAQGRACYYVANAADGTPQLLVLPGRERLPLQIR